MIFEHNLLASNTIQKMLSKDYEWKQGVYTPYAMKDQFKNIAETRHAETKVVPDSKENKLLFRTLRDIFKRANKEYNFKLNNIISTKIQKYTESDHFDWHRDELIEANDHGTSGKRCLSLSILLSDDFTGGEFILEDMEGKHHYLKKQAGSCVVFPSTWLHKVSKIKSGKRYVCTAWAYGEL